jgi:signal transduction histidine kinase
MLLVILPLTLVLLVVAFGGAAVHTGAMREMVAVRDERAVQAAAAALELGLAAGESPEQLLRKASSWLSGSPEPPQTAAIILVDEHGKLLAHSDPEPIRTDYFTHPGVASALRGDSGTTFQRDTETGDEMVIAYSPVGNTGWGLLMVEPWSAIANPLLRYSQLAPLALVPALIMAAGALYFGLHQIVQPLRRLNRRSARLGKGDFDALNEPVEGIQEIQALQATLARMAAQLQAAQTGIRNYAAAVTQGQENERARLARELHDETVQNLIALEHQSHMLRRAIDRDRVAAARKADELAVVDDLNKSGKVKASLTIAGVERRLDPAVDLTLYRIAQEALSNVARHSGADRVDVRVETTENLVTLTISDDGRGFVPSAQPSELAQAGHFGLMGMHERAQLVGAQLSIQSEPGKGARIEITLPEQE